MIATTRLPDVEALSELLAVDPATEKILGFRGLEQPAIVRQQFDRHGLWWAVPFAKTVGCDFAFRLAPGPGHGAVLLCLLGHAVTIASTPDRAIFAMLAVETLLVGPKGRARLQAAWPEVREKLRAAVALTGGDPDALDGVLHLADPLPKSVAPAPLADEEQRRATLWQITREPDTSTNDTWRRSLDSRLAPEDAAACLRILQGNHGLDGTRFSAGLFPNGRFARELLVACARRVRAAGLVPDPAWAAVVEAIAEREQPEATDFVSATVGVGPVRAWDGLAAASFWYDAISRRIPDGLTSAAEETARAAGAEHVLAARRIFA